MAWTADFRDLDETRERARKALSLPIGLASPLWLAFGAVASAGVAWWWATKWTRATDLEALSGAAKSQIAAMEALVERENAVASQAVDAVAAVLTAASIIPSEPSTPAEPVADDLTRLTGIGPKLAAALAERGVTTFAQLAAWTEEQTEALDAELSLKGRIARDAWVAQAKRLAAETGNV